jgi:hypothetical protein
MANLLNIDINAIIAVQDTETLDKPFMQSFSNLLSELLHRSFLKMLASPKAALS